jgi:hypothetical protein
MFYPHQSKIRFCVSRKIILPVCGKNYLIITNAKHFQLQSEYHQQSLETMNLSDSLIEKTIPDLRPEQLDVAHLLNLPKK